MIERERDDRESHELPAPSCFHFLSHSLWGLISTNLVCSLLSLEQSRLDAI